MMRSRGYRRSQIVALYALQACILCLGGKADWNANLDMDFVSWLHRPQIS